MWSYESYIAKAQDYFTRARQQPLADSEESILWSLLALEFLLRSSLAKIHPGLVAAMDGDSLLQAHGIATTGAAKTLPMHSLLARVVLVVDEFDASTRDDARFLLDLRNAELHTALSPLANLSQEHWLPRPVRVVDCLCQNLGLTTADLIGDDVEREGRALSQEANRRVQARVSERITQASAGYAALTDEEAASRRLPLALISGPPDPTRQIVACPACGSLGIVRTAQIRLLNERVEGDDLLSDAVFVAEGFECPVCGLALENAAELAAGGIRQRFVVTESIPFEDRLLGGEPDWEYGND